MDRCGMATSTRKVAMYLWNRRLPEGDPRWPVRKLYREENRGKSEPSGSQDVIGLIYPGVNLLDIDYEHEKSISIVTFWGRYSQPSGISSSRQANLLERTRSS